MDYLLFEKSAVEELINNNQLQSIEFDLGSRFIRCIKNEGEVSIKNVIVKKEKDGQFFVGKGITRTILVIDLRESQLLNQCSDQELLVVLQKTFRYAIRFWEKKPPTNCEKVFKNHTVIFPFPYSQNSSYRIVLARNVKERRLELREIKEGLLVYKYSNEGIPSSTEENLDTDIYRKCGGRYFELLSEFRSRFLEQIKNKNEDCRNAINIVELDHMKGNSSFKFLSFNDQMNKLTKFQRRIVTYANNSTPIRIEGPAGTGKTAAMVLRAVNMLQNARKEQIPLEMYYFTHSKSTELSIKNMICSLMDESFFEENSEQRLRITTLQDYCTEYIRLKETQVIDLDASEAKQHQLFLIHEAYTRVKEKKFNTFKFLMSSKCVDFFENEQENRVISLLQYEFSVNIKGMAEGDLEAYKRIRCISNGIPFENEHDKEYVYSVFKEYQQDLEYLSVYDTDDIILETIARLNAPLWRRARIRDGIDYMFVDEMHLFNINEQQIFHYLTKDVTQTDIPICFALDYGQLIGERVELDRSYIEKEFSKNDIIKEEFGTVFRSSQQIAELCATITSSGALLFDSFINPYKYCESGFTANEEALCDTPKLVSYKTDKEMLQSLDGYIKSFCNMFKCQHNDIAIVFFDEELMNEFLEKKYSQYEINCLDGRAKAADISKHNSVICSLPDYINGLEFHCVILVGVDDGRVPPTAVYDVSANFLIFNSLNKLYLACSRARYNVTILENCMRGSSSCLMNSIKRGTLQIEDQKK